MGIEDIRLKLDIFEHPKTRELADIFEDIETHLGAVAVVSWLRLIIHAARNAPDGHLKMTPRRLASTAHWRGSGDIFAGALIEVGLMEKTEEGYQLHDYAEHQPWVAASAQRIDRAKKAAAARWQKPKDKGSNAGRMPQASGKHPKSGSSNAPTVPYLDLNLDHTVPDQIDPASIDPNDILAWFNSECCPPLVPEAVIGQQARYAVSRGFDSLRKLYGPVDNEARLMRWYLSEAAAVYSRADLPCRWGIANVLKEENIGKVVNGYFEPKDEGEDWVKEMKAKNAGKL